MAKHVTANMERINRKISKRKGGNRQTSPGQEAWVRLCRNRTALLGLFIVIAFFLIAIFADIIAPYDYAAQDYNALNQPPSLQHLFGTDNFGRDLFSRCVYAARISVPISVLAVFFSLLVGGVLGVFAAFKGGRADIIIMRIIDIWMAIPGTLLCIAIVACFGNNMTVLVVGICIASVPNVARNCRAAIFTVKSNDYIESSRAIGANSTRLITRHMLPNAVGLIIISLVQLLGRNILTIAMLSYVGVGITPPTPEWGSLLSAGKSHMQSAPYLVFCPGLCIMLVVLGFNLLGDGLRDALDPRLK